MKNARCSLQISIVGSFLIFCLATGLSAKDEGPYLHCGITYWDGLEAPEIDFDTEEIDLETSPLEYEVDGSRTQLSIGAGYNLDERWGFEAFYVSTPEQIVSSTDWDLPPLEPDGEPITVSWGAKVQQTIMGINTVYDLDINHGLSLFGKAGIAFIHHSSEAHVVFHNQPSTVMDEDDTQGVFGAIGARIPIRAGDTSITIAYQVVETSDGSETNFEFGFQWNF